MNAAAYDAQQFFDQREALLRSLSASAVRNVGSEHLDDALAHTGAAPQVEVLPLQEADGAYDWALLTPPGQHAAHGRPRPSRAGADPCRYPGMAVTHPGQRHPPAVRHGTDPDHLAAPPASHRQAPIPVHPARPR
ncbi:hypothetical protein G6F23_014769 [Rhizopus arrhizus]|nr:hypothetical protein G6F23_014769 [Rhizopus arrhizus]